MIEIHEDSSKPCKKKLKTLLLVSRKPPFNQHSSSLILQGRGSQCSGSPAACVQRSYLRPEALAATAGSVRPAGPRAPDERSGKMMMIKEKMLECACQSASASRSCSPKRMHDATPRDTQASSSQCQEDVDQLQPIVVKSIIVEYNIA